MDRDPLVRLMLFGILVALVALAVAGGGGALVGGDGPRFTLGSTHAGSPVMFRLDTHTGETWKFELRGGNDRWKPIREPDEEAAVAGPPGGSQATPRVPPPPTVPAPAPPVAVEPETPAAAPLPGREGPEWDVAALARALENPELNRDLRIWSAGRLALQDVPRSTDALLGVQGDADPTVVAAALTALAGRFDTRIPEAVARARSHADPAVQAAAAAVAPQ